MKVVLFKASPNILQNVVNKFREGLFYFIESQSEPALGFTSYETSGSHAFSERGSFLQADFLEQQLEEFCSDYGNFDLACVFLVAPEFLDFDELDSEITAEINQRVFLENIIAINSALPYLYNNARAKMLVFFENSSTPHPFLDLYQSMLRGVRFYLEKLMQKNDNLSAQILCLEAESKLEITSRFGDKLFELQEKFKVNAP